METFSTRYGYNKPSDEVIRGTITLEIQNAICTCYDELQKMFYNSIVYKRTAYYSQDYYQDLEEYLWIYFLKERKANFRTRMEYHTVATKFIENNENEWYRKLDLVEMTIDYLYCLDSHFKDNCHKLTNDFIDMLNHWFENLNFGYRVVGTKILAITSEEEIKTIEDAMKSSADNIKMHLSKALELYGKRPDGDYSNSIKESISAVEAYCREKTGKSTLGGALKKLEHKGIVFPKVLKDAFEKLYGYTNDEKTGIRHALMDPSGTYAPKSEEAYFMLVSCSAFINYLRQK